MPDQSLIDLSLELQAVAEKAALSVCDMLVEAFYAPKNIEQKSGFHDIVTEFDKQSEAMIIASIERDYPDSTILGEEGGSRGNGRVHWFIDPIDGTMNFASGVPFFCVSIGAAVDNKMIAGVIVDPIRKEVFSASLKGSFCNGERIYAGQSKIDKEASLVCSFPFMGHQLFGNDGELYYEMSQRFRCVRRMGSSALELAYVAANRIDMALGTQTKAWDVAAGMCLVEQAGGRYIGLNIPVANPPWPPAQYLACSSEFDLQQTVLKPFLV